MKNSKFSFFKISTLAAICLAISVVFTSCKDDDDEVTPVPAPSISNLMVVHASPDAPGVDLLIDNVKLNTSALTYPSNTPYIPVFAGSRNIKVNVAGSATTVIEANLPFIVNKSYSVYAINEVSAIEPLVIEDILATPATGKAHVRFIHLSPDAPAVDVAVDGGAEVFSDFTFKEASAFTPLDAGTYDLEVRLAGSGIAVLDLDPITLQAGKIYTVFAKGFAAGSGNQALGAQIIVNK